VLNIIRKQLAAQSFDARMLCFGDFSHRMRGQDLLQPLDSLTRTTEPVAAIEGGESKFANSCRSSSNV